MTKTKIRESQSVAPTSKQCAAKIFDGRWDYPCSKPAKVFRIGKNWCGIHDPEKAAVRTAKLHEKWDAERAVRTAISEVAGLERRVLEATVSVGPNALAQHPTIEAALRALAKAKESLSTFRAVTPQQEKP